MEAEEEEQTNKLNIFEKVKWSIVISGEHGRHRAGAVPVPAKASGRGGGEGKEEEGGPAASQTAERSHEVRIHTIHHSVKSPDKSSHNLHSYRILKEAEKRDKLDMAKRERELKHQQFVEEKKRKQDEISRQKQEEKMKKMHEVEVKRQQAAMFKEQVRPGGAGVGRVVSGCGTFKACPPAQLPQDSLVGQDMFRAPAPLVRGHPAAPQPRSPTAPPPACLDPRLSVVCHSVI